MPRFGGLAVVTTGRIHGSKRGVEVSVDFEDADANVHSGGFYGRRLVSVVIPARDAASTIAAQLDALVSQTYRGPWELVVVDNGSTDSTVAIVEGYRERLPILRVVPASDRVGVNYVRNVGAQTARGEAILFCDADDVVNERWLSSMVAGLDRYDAVGGPLDVHSLNHRGAARYALSQQPSMTALPRPLNFWPIAPGGNCAIRTSVWRAIGEFDESYVGGGDEIEFFWRLQARGFSLGFAPDAVVAYRLPSSLRAAMRTGFVKGRAGARICREFKDVGARLDIRRSLRAWLGLAARSYRLLGPAERRAAWLVSLAQRTGMVAGGLRQKTLYF